MGSDDLTQKLPDEKGADKTTQPMIEELVAEVRAMREELRRMSQRLDTFDARFDTFDARFDAVDARLDSLEGRLTHDIEGVDNNVGELRDTMDVFNRRSLNTDRDYARLLKRVEGLESKPS
ncbi:MAG TPA: hypothetical protein VI837_08345 [Blastocatellia bacterium]|nr:hypothetical protein [Blastocatellia bacterium]